MKIMKPLALLAVLLLNQSLFAQNTNNSLSNGEFYLKGEEKEAATGSQYFDDVFTAAKLKEQNMSMIRYNAYTDRVEVKKPNGEIMILTPEDNFVITTSNQKYNLEYVNYTADGEKTTGYLNRIVNNDNIKVYSRMKVFLQAESGTSNGYQKVKPAAYKKKAVKYFIKIKDDAIVELPENKKKAAKLLPGKEAQITEFLNSNKLSLDEEADVKKFGEYLATL